MSEATASTATDTWTAHAPGGDRALRRRYRLWQRVELDAAAGRLSLHAVDGEVTHVDLDEVLIVAGLSKMALMWAPMPMPTTVLGRVRIVTEDATCQVALHPNDNTTLFKRLSENCPNAVVIWRHGHVHAPEDDRGRLGEDRRRLAANHARLLLREQWELSTVLVLLVMGATATVMAVIGLWADMAGAALAMVLLCIAVVVVVAWRGRRQLRRALAALPDQPTET
ncbi:MAG: hypothetical protein GVY28_11465 [Alphaproteobacteria bacterium]|jgi:hypothetical protein|nr:hypothetical protein [Alphaproteobacteria bacterium]